MLALYDLPISSYGCKIRILLRNKGVSWTSITPPDGYGSPAYCQIVPAGTIPALDHDGFIIAESAAIAEYINELYPTPGMLPDDIKARAAARAMSQFHDGRIEPVLRAYFGVVAPANRDADFIAENALLMQRRCQQFAQMVRPDPLLTGSGLSFADCGFASSFALLECLQDILDFTFTLPPVLAAYKTALIAHPSVGDEYAAYATALNQWATAKMAS